jgi:hypothetical protein
LHAKDSTANDLIAGLPPISGMKLLRTLARGKGATSRRQLLKALGVSAAATPFIPVLDGWARAAASPQRMFLLYSPHGVIPQNYWPTGTETAFTFPTGGILEPLTPYKGDMVIFKGLKRDTRGPGDHERCFCSMWTGTALAAGTQLGNGPSIDQIVAKSIKPQTDFESLQFAVQPHYTSDSDSTSRAGRSDGNMIYAAAKQMIPAEFDPFKMFDRLFASGFGGGTGPDPNADKLRAKKMSLLDFVSGELGDLQATVVGKDDKLKIDSHLESVRDIERRLQTPEKSCGAIPRPDGSLNIDLGANFPTIIGIMNKLATAAFACDRTRIASMQYSRGFSRHTHTWLGLKDWHHTISHNTGAVGPLTAMQRWYMERIKDLLDLLKGTTEQGKPMLDSMLVIYVNELFTPWNHIAYPAANWTVGKANGALASTGRYVDFANGYDHNQFLTTMCHAMGAKEVVTVGDLGGNGPLPKILA